MGSDADPPDVSDASALALQRAVRAERARLGLSQDDLAARLGWSRATVTAVETGARRIYAHELPDLCGALECGIDQLFVNAPTIDREQMRLG